MIRRSLGEWWMLRYPIAALPKPAAPADEPVAVTASDDRSPVAPVSATASDLAGSPNPDPAARRPPVWWTGGAIGAALRGGGWGAWLVLTGGLVAVVDLARAR
jgi:hypothetical protein